MSGYKERAVEAITLVLEEHFAVYDERRDVWLLPLVGGWSIRVELRARNTRVDLKVTSPAGTRPTAWEGTYLAALALRDYRPGSWVTVDLQQAPAVLDAWLAAVIASVWASIRRSTLTRLPAEPPPRPTKDRAAAASTNPSPDPQKELQP